MEATEQTLKREFEEEIGAKIEVDSLMAVGEILSNEDKVFDFVSRQI